MWRVFDARVADAMHALIEGGLSAAPGVARGCGSRSEGAASAYMRPTRSPQRRERWKDALRITCGQGLSARVVALQAIAKTIMISSLSGRLGAAKRSLKDGMSSSRIGWRRPVLLRWRPQQRRAVGGLDSELTGETEGRAAGGPRCGSRLLAERRKGRRERTSVRQRWSTSTRSTRRRTLRFRRQL